ncbi:MAG TPA: polysaccharide deacetylase family protein [Acidimicrobiia bacterium]|nr:polysaccharide deacetylase family protein [Acidimicrobiia bacterium]
MSLTPPIWLISLATIAAACVGTPSSPSTTTTLPPPTSTTEPTPTTTMAPSTTTLPKPTTTTVPTTTTPSTTITSTQRVTTTATTSTASALAVWLGDTGRPQVSLTFDAGSDRGYAEEILDLVVASEIRVTFGMTGKWAEANPDLLRRMIDEGHTLMNHTYDHPHMETLTTEQRLEQLRRTESIIVGLTGASTKPYFRPPYGAYNDRVLIDVASDGYRYSVMWTVDSLGWRGISPEKFWTVVSTVPDRERSSCSTSARRPPTTPPCHRSSVA